MTGDFTQARAAAGRLAAENLKEAAASLLVWNRKGKLPEATVFQRIAAVLEPHCLADDSMQQAEKIVIDLCLAQAAGEDIQPKDML